MGRCGSSVPSASSSQPVKAGEQQGLQIGSRHQDPARLTYSGTNSNEPTRAPSPSTTQGTKAIDPTRVGPLRAVRGDADSRLRAGVTGLAGQSVRSSLGMSSSGRGAGPVSDRRDSDDVVDNAWQVAFCGEVAVHHLRQGTHDSTAVRQVDLEVVEQPWLEGRPGVAFFEPLEDEGPAGERWSLQPHGVRVQVGGDVGSLEPEQRDRAVAFRAGAAQVAQGAL